MYSSEPNEFLNKNVLVTGASSGIGQSVAYFFLNSGAQVAMVGTDVESMKRMVKQNNFINATIMEVDLLSDIHIYDLKTSVVERLKNKLDIIVNCAGIKLDGDVQKTFPQEFDFTLDLNLRSNYAIIKHFYKFLNPGSSIINMSCLYGNRPMCGMISYAMSKAGLDTLTKYAAAELANRKIRGMRNMNSRFEPDGVNMAEWFGSVGKMFTGEKDVVPIQDAMKLKQFIDEKIRMSNFSTRDSDAHTTINANYKNIEGNDDKLAKKFLKENQQ